VKHRGTPHESFVDVGIPGDVVTIAFPHSGSPGVAPAMAEGSLRGRAQGLFRALLASAGGDFPSSALTSIPV
jgi:hypothetical protein